MPTNPYDVNRQPFQWMNWELARNRQVYLQNHPEERRVPAWTAANFHKNISTKPAAKKKPARRKKGAK